MNRNRTILRQWLGAVLAAVIIAAAVPATAWGQTPVQQGVRAGNNTTTVNGTSVTAGQVVSAGRGTTVTVTTATPLAGKVAKVTVTKITDIKATGITVTSAGNVGEMNGNATLQMTANFDPTYTDDKTVAWIVAPAPESSATATIDENGLLTAGTTQGNVVVTATATNGPAMTDDDKTDSKTITITTIPLDETSTTITVATATYNGGNPVTPAVTVKYGTTDLVKGQDYTLGSWFNNTNAGTASVTITGAGAYSGSIVKNFTIDRANWSGSISISYTKISNGYKKVHVQYNGEGSGNISKWERCYSNNANWNGFNPDWEVPDESGTNTSFDDTFTGAVQKVQYRVTIEADAQNHKQTVITSTMFSTP